MLYKKSFPLTLYAYLPNYQCIKYFLVGTYLRYPHLNLQNVGLPTLYKYKKRNDAIGDGLS